MRLALIYARSENRCIGKEGRLPWHLPDDLAFFENTTIAHPVIMGRRTWEERGEPLPGRLNIVVTANREYEVAPGVMRAGSLETAMMLAEVHTDVAYVIGGVRLYADAFPMAEVVLETLVHARVDGDTFLPPFDFSTWQTERLMTHEVDRRHEYAFSIFRHERSRPT